MDNPIIPLSEAAERYPGARVVVYGRVSSWGQAGPGKAKIGNQTSAVYREVKKTAADFRVRYLPRGVEEGKLSNPRPSLRDAVDYATKCGAIIVAADLSRFIRSESYHRTKNPDAVPTKREMELLRKFTLCVPLATVLDPSASESERHSAATRRPGTCGRPRSITPEMARRIFEDLGALLPAPRGWRWAGPLEEIAADFGVSVEAIRRESERPSPSGLTWRELGFKKSEEAGFIKIEPSGGKIILIDYPTSSNRGWWGKVGRPPRGTTHGSGY